jgi:DNA-binding MarR family transcriptional regulator
MIKARQNVDLARCAKIAESCMNFRLRKLSRLVGAIYDEALRPSGLRGTQFNVLVALALLREVTVKRLAMTLGVDRTTLSRNLAPLERDGLVQSQPGEDGRERLLALTDSGHACLKSAIERWELAQARVVEKLGRAKLQQLAESLQAAAKIFAED